MCNDIGEAAYVDSLVAAALLDAIARLPSGPAIRRRLSERYGVPWAPSLTSARARLCTGWFGLDVASGGPLKQTCALFHICVCSIGAVKRAGSGSAAVTENSTRWLFQHKCVLGWSGRAHARSECWQGPRRHCVPIHDMQMWQHWPWRDPVFACQQRPLT